MENNRGLAPGWLTPGLSARALQTWFIPTQAGQVVYIQSLSTKLGLCTAQPHQRPGTDA